jgi:hypothetical protein
VSLHVTFCAASGDVCSGRVVGPQSGDETAGWDIRHVDDVSDEMSGRPLWHRLRTACDAATDELVTQRTRLLITCGNRLSLVWLSGAT